MKNNSAEYDTSDYPTDHFLHNTTNAKVIGNFKDETNSVPPVEFVWLRSKMYSLLLPKDKEKKTAKGVKRSFVSKYIRHNQYVKCLVDEEMTSAKFHNILCRKHALHTGEFFFQAEAGIRDKRYLIS